MRAALVLLSLSGAFVAAQTKPPLKTAELKSYPVWWASNLKLEKIEDAEARLDRPFSPEELYLLEGTADAFGQPPQPRVRNCNELLAHIDSRKWDFLSLDRVAGWGSIGADCAVLKALAHAVPARQSGARNLAWTPALFSSLPAGICAVDGGESHAAAMEAGEHGLSLRRYRQRFKAGTAEERQMDRTLLTLDSESTFGWYALVARGDFDGDGWEEIVIETYGVANHSQRGSFAAYILTRKSETELFRIVKEIF